jgi:hypothetical protein
MTASVLFANARHRPIDNWAAVPTLSNNQRDKAGATRDASLTATRPWCGEQPRYGQVEDTIVTVSTLSFGAFALEDADVALVDDVELPDAGSTVPAMVTL